MARLSLTPEIAALAERFEPDPGPDPGTEELSTEDYEAFAAKLLAEHAPEAIQVFAYGSLLWSPAFEVVATSPATAMGWHRSFCFSLNRWRGTRELPGLMLALDRGGSCNGYLLQGAAGNMKMDLLAFLDRELDAKRPTNIAKWIWVNTPQGKVRALTCIADQDGPAYSGRRSHHEVADIISRAAGHLGSNAIYLQRTVEQLLHHGIKDRNLWELQERVAELILARNPR